MKILIGLIFLLLSAASASAQTTIQAVWDAPAASDNILSFNFYLDTQPAVSVPVVVDASCACIKKPFAVSVGSHTVRVTGVYLLLTSDPTSITETPSAVATFTLNGGAQIKNLKITK